MLALQPNPAQQGQLGSAVARIQLHREDCRDRRRGGQDAPAAADGCRIRPRPRRWRGLSRWCPAFGRGLGPDPASRPLRVSHGWKSRTESRSPWSVARLGHQHVRLLRCSSGPSSVHRSYATGFFGRQGLLSRIGVSGGRAACGHARNEIQDRVEREPGGSAADDIQRCMRAEVDTCQGRDGRRGENVSGRAWIRLAVALKTAFATAAMPMITTAPRPLAPIGSASLSGASMNVECGPGCLRARASCSLR